MALLPAQLNEHIVTGILGGIPAAEVWLELSLTRILVMRAVRYGRAGGADEKEAARTLIRRLYARGGWGPNNAPAENIRAWAMTFLPGTPEFHVFDGNV